MNLKLEEVNALPAAEFAVVFGDVAERSPWVARDAARARPYPDRAAMLAAFDAAVDRAREADRHALLCAHPDLAGRAALAGHLTPESGSEQRGAGLDRLTAEQLQRLTALNTVYREKFGFPFILAVRGATFSDIMAALESRVDNEVDAEFATALAQVKRIVRFRLEDRVA